MSIGSFERQPVVELDAIAAERHGKTHRRRRAPSHDRLRMTAELHGTGLEEQLALPVEQARLFEDDMDALIRGEVLTAREETPAAEAPSTPPEVPSATREDLEEEREPVLLEAHRTAR